MSHSNLPTHSCSSLRRSDNRASANNRSSASARKSWYCSSKRVTSRASNSSPSPLAISIDELVECGSVRTRPDDGRFSLISQTLQRSLADAGRHDASVLVPQEALLDSLVVDIREWVPPRSFR